MGEYFLGFKDLNLKLRYDSEVDNLVDDFYNPILKNTKEYHRISGYFNSTTLAMAARGMKDFILNGGKMKLLCGAQLEPEDVKAILDGEKSPEKILSSNFLNDIDSIEDNIKKNHIQVLGYMVAKGLLEIKIVVKIDKKSKGIMHYKIGINKDFEGNFISFSGSNNETGSGWNYNLEQFAVYKSWIDEQNEYLLGDIDLFNRTWDNNSQDYEVIDIPSAVKKKLIEYSPKKFEDLKFDSNIDKTNNEKPKLFNNQLSAVDNWFKNDKKGIFAMATGTGKTFTALGCLDKLLSQEEKLFTIISVPQQHLIQQWIKSIKKFKINEKIVIVSSSNINGKKEMFKSILDISNGLLNKVIILTTPNSMSKDDFINIIKKTHNNIPYFLIVDEMHEMGSYTFRQGLLEDYDYRLGLSATPERKYDEVGTKILFKYFGDVVFSFPLEKALKEFNPLTNMTYLTSYTYNPKFINLTDDELKKYQEFTRKIIIEQNKDLIDENKLESLLFKRANIIKNAENKFDVLESILRDLGSDVSNLIIYCSDKQIDKVLDIAGNKYNLTVKKFTNKESAKPSEEYGGKSYREVILDDFANQKCQCLVAMHCLDEGVDVPSASKAILLCNSTNSREFIQRLGRILRRYENKNNADIYDMVIKPHKYSNETIRHVEEQIYEKELYRCEKIGKLATNKSQTLIEMYDM